jgi:enamine deaminase RidA (YjgF/YER057c/UK114 family)
MKIAGGALTDVVSMRIYIVQEKLDETHHISAALKEFFPADQAPATTWIGVHALANEDFLIEIEAIAVID